MPRLSILVVEDDPLSRKVMAAHLKDHSVTFAEDAAAGKRLIESGKPDLCFIDLQLGGDDPRAGLDLIPLAVAKGAYAVVMSGHDGEAIVERAYELGCDDFHGKGDEAASVGTVLARYLSRKQTVKDDPFSGRFVTADPETKTAVQEALLYAPSELPLMLLGPSGTGKTSLAQLIHERSGRPGAFVAINCSAYAEDLLEAELFGYKKGAFTGANDAHKGKLLAADRGTLFLDEIGSMSLKMQTKLLKAIEEKSFFPLGSDRPETSRFRVISATLENLPGLIKAGRMRFDFFQRVHGLSIELKPLSARKCDLMPLINSFSRTGKRLAFSAEAKKLVLAHDWPGNAREVKRFVELLAAGGEGRVSAEAVARLLRAVGAEQSAPAGFLTDEQLAFAREKGLDALLDRVVDEAVGRSLADNSGKKTAVLEELHISTRLLYAALKRRGATLAEDA